MTLCRCFLLGTINNKFAGNTTSSNNTAANDPNSPRSKLEQQRRNELKLTHTGLPSCQPTEKGYLAHSVIQRRYILRQVYFSVSFREYSISFKYVCYCSTYDTQLFTAFSGLLQFIGQNAQSWERKQMVQLFVLKGSARIHSTSIPWSNAVSTALFSQTQNAPIGIFLRTRENAHFTLIALP